MRSVSGQFRRFSGSLCSIRDRGKARIDVELASIDAGSGE
jgi:hypothetical protein